MCRSFQKFCTLRLRVQKVDAIVLIFVTVVSQTSVKNNVCILVGCVVPVLQNRALKWKKKLTGVRSRAVTSAVFTLDARLLAICQYSEGPVTGHLNTGFSWFRCVYKQMLRWSPRFQAATTCFSCSPPDLNLLVTNFIFCMHVK